MNNMDVDELAQIIRKVDGRNSLGAGALAEAILEEVKEQKCALEISMAATFGEEVEIYQRYGKQPLGSCTHGFINNFRRAHTEKP